MNITNNNRIASESALSDGRSCDGAVPEAKGRPEQHTEGGGRLSRMEHFRRLEHLRRLPGNCMRCGKPSPTGTCERCRAYHQAYKARKRAVLKDQPSEIQSQFAQLRRELTHLRATVKRMTNRWRQAYRKGYASGLAGKRARFRKQAWMPPAMSAQELATISHAFDTTDET